MHTLNDVKAKFPHAYSCGGELIARIDNDNVVLASLGNGSFNLTAKGLELMGAEEVVEVKEPKAPKAPKAQKAPKPAPVVEEPPTVESADLDDILGE